MAKQGMKRPNRTHTKPKNEVPPVPEIQGRAKSGKMHVNAIIAGTHAPSQKVYHTASHSESKNKREDTDDAYSVMDNDLAEENLTNDIPDSDLQFL